VLLSGDIFDSPTCRESVPLVREALASCGVPVFIAPGNHDYLTTGSPWLEERWPENVYIFPAGLSSVALPQLNCRVYGAGYRSMDCPGLLEGFSVQGEEQYNLAVLHGDPNRLNSPYCPITASQVRESGLHYLALGHIHKGDAFRASGTLCAWPGSPMGRGYDETGEKGVYIVELGDQTEIRFVSLDTPRFYDLEVDTDTQSPEDVLPATDNSSFFRVTLTGSGGEALEQLKARFGGRRNLEWIDRREAKQNPWDRIGEDTLEGNYFRLLREKMDQAEGEAAEQIALAAELSLKILMGKEVVL
jgi:DNA repair exonuclease SbcCD nuclease subunit